VGNAALPILTIPADNPEPTAVGKISKNALKIEKTDPLLLAKWEIPCTIVRGHYDVAIRFARFAVAPIGRANPRHGPHSDVIFFLIPPQSL